MKLLNPSRIFILLLISILASGCGSGIKNRDSKGSTVICFGNSITYGTGAPEGENYPSYLSRLLGRDIINAGIGGDDTSDALARIKKDVLDEDPYLVIVEFGGNDFLKSTPKEDTLNNLEEIISRIQDKGAMVALCDISSGVFLSGYRRDFKKLAKKAKAVFIPRLLEDILTDPSLKSDQIHPNSAGYKIVADKVYEAVKRYIK